MATISNAKKEAKVTKTGTKKATETKATAKKTSGRKAATKKIQEVYLQYAGKEVKEKDVIEKIRNVWTGELGNKISGLVDLKVYIKMEENLAYYVINGDVTGSVEL